LNTLEDSLCFSPGNLYEVIISLFTKCNLNCDFCFEDHTNDIDIEAIKNIPKLLEDNYPEELKNPKIEIISLGLLGGELFSDDIPDSMFEIYEELCKNIMLVIRRYLPDVTFHNIWFSNGVHTKNERILKLFNNINTINKVKCVLFLSYDCVGRFKTKRQFELFEKTFRYFYDNYRISSIVSTLTKKQIENREQFKSLFPPSIQMYLNYYTPTKGQVESNESDDLQPNDDDLYTFLTWAAENNMFEFELLALWLEKVYKKKEVVKTCLFDKNITYYDSSFGKIGFIPRASQEEKNDKMKCMNGLRKRGCLHCEYYMDTCISPCWLTALSKDYDFNNCYAKRFIEYLYAHPEIEKRYDNTYII
jgi:hypothetical protein